MPRTPFLSEPGVVACDTSLWDLTLEPGASKSWSGALDVRTGDGPTHPVVLRLAVGGAMSAGTRTSVTTDIVFPLVDRPARQASYEAALAAFAADPRLQAFPIPDPDRTAMPGLDQIQTDLSWWHGAWELWLFSGGHGAGRLRLRYDPTTGLVDVITVPIGSPSP